MRILLVEDERRLSLSLKRGLEREGYAVDCVFDGAAAKLRLEVNHGDYDLVILDLMLPGLDGIEVCRSLRQRSISLPVLMLTARDSTHDKVTGIDAGADDYLAVRLRGARGAPAHAAQAPPRAPPS